MPQFFANEPYYVQHFRHVLEMLERHYGAQLSSEEVRFLDQLERLSPQALCLYVRLCNRRGRHFRVSKISYPECEPLANTINELVAVNLLSWAACENHGALQIFSFTELKESLRKQAPPFFARKSDCVAWLAEWECKTEWLGTLYKTYPVISLHRSHWPFLSYLYFGEITENLSGFVVQELGHVVPEPIDSSSFKPLFASREDAERCYSMEMLYAEFRLLRDSLTPIDLLTWWEAMAPQRDTLPRNALHWFDRLVERLGRILERSGALEQAIGLYLTSPAAPNRERLSRVYYKLGKIEKAREVCAAIKLTPCSDEELYYALNALARMDKLTRSSAATNRIKQSRLLAIEPFEGNVEEAVLHCLQQQGWEGLHTENWLWSALFGLTFWDIIYDPQYGGFHQPLQLAPTDMWQRSFYTSRQLAIEERLRYFENKAQINAHLEAMAASKYGITNPFVGWQHETIPILALLISKVPGSALSNILRRMAQDTANHFRGFPDLFLWNEHSYQFLEVKLHKDRLSAAQSNWLDCFEEFGIQCDVLAVAVKVEAE